MKKRCSSTGDFSKKSFFHHKQILNPVGTREVTCSVKMLNFPDLGHHLVFWRKLKMPFISKTLTEIVISSNVWTFWVLETLDIVPVKKVEFPEFCLPS